MKRIVQIVFALSLLAVVVVAIGLLRRGEIENVEAAHSIASRVVAIGTAAGSSDAGEELATTPKTVPRLTPRTGEIVVDLLDANLDGDDYLEQIMILMQRDDPGAGIYIALADYQESRELWIRSREGLTTIVKPSSFDIGLVDLAGDHKPMIVCSGLDKNNRMVLAAFRPVEEASGLSFYLACILGGLEIGIEEKDRPVGYQKGLAVAASWDILVMDSDPASTNPLDRTRTRWSWDAGRGRYIAGEKLRIPGRNVEKASLARILTGKEKDFEGFLEGLWILAESPQASRGMQSPSTTRDEGSPARFLYFDPAGKTISFRSGAAQDAFAWTDSASTATGLFMVLENLSIQGLMRRIQADIAGSDRIRVRVEDDRQVRIIPESDFSGTYTRYTEHGTSASAIPAARGRESGLPDITGSYTGEDGSRFIVSGKEYVLIQEDGDTPETGYQRLYRSGDYVILDLFRIGSEGIASERRSYIVEVQTRQEADRRIKLLILEPARIGSTGVEPEGGFAIQYSTG